METLYTDSIEVLRNTRTSDDGGSISAEVEVIASTIKGKIVPVSANARFQYGQPSVVEATHRCYCSTSVDIVQSDKLRSPPTTGTVYEVKYVVSSDLGSNAHKEIELKRI